MNSKGTSGKLYLLNKSPKVYTIKQSKKTMFDPNSSTLYWNPDVMAQLDNGVMLSSMTMLSHEIDYAQRYDEDPEQCVKDHSTEDADYGNKEDRRACENEQETAEKHGEVAHGQETRTNHNATFISNTGATPEEQSKACRANNDLL